MKTPQQQLRKERNKSDYEKNKESIKAKTLARYYNFVRPCREFIQEHGR